MKSMWRYLNKHLVRGIFLGMFAILLFRAGGADAAALALSCGQWNVVSIPSEGTSPQLSGVAAVSANDVWTVGFYLNNSNAYQTLTEHWNGTQWSIVPSPDTGIASYLRGVTALATNDVWAVGYSQNGSTYPTLIEHWDGTQWSIVPSPSPGSTFSVLDGVAAIAPNDVWAVGSYQNAVSSSVQTLTEH